MKKNRKSRPVFHKIIPSDTHSIRGRKELGGRETVETGRGGGRIGGIGGGLSIEAHRSGIVQGLYNGRRGWREETGNRLERKSRGLGGGNKATLQPSGANIIKVRKEGKEGVFGVCKKEGGGET